MTSHQTHFTDYMILEADTADELSSAVMQAIHNRWQPYGDMTVANRHNGVTLLQPMVQHAEWYG